MPVVKMLYDMKELNGITVSVYECGLPPQDDMGEDDVEAFARQSGGDRFYEVYVQGGKKLLFTSKTPPTDAEIAFQLSRTGEAGTKTYERHIFVAIVIVMFFAWLWDF